MIAKKANELLTNLAMNAGPVPLNTISQIGYSIVNSIASSSLVNFSIFIFKIY